VAGSGSAPIEWHLLDITSSQSCEELIRAQKPEVIYHLAGVSFVPQAEDDFLGALAANVAGADNLLRAAHAAGRDIRFIMAGSADVYGKVPLAELPVHEETVPRPVNAYSTTKLMAEIVADRWHRLGRVAATILRPFNHIGPGQNGRFVVPGFARQLAAIAQGKQDPQIKVGNLSARKDFTDVRDVVCAYRLAALRKPPPQAPGRYVICSGRSVAIQDILDGLIAVSGVEVEVVQDPARMRPAEVPELYGSFAKAEAELGWRPQYSLLQSLGDVYRNVFDRMVAGHE
jgi:GDP-4-dehydro-6-deoxy-D-mannose reductase